MTEIRKIQQVGRSTLVVAIPKKWADEVELRQGSHVNIERETDGSFRIITKEANKRQRPKFSLNADKCGAPGMLVRALTGIYLTGVDTIRVYSKELQPSHLEQTRCAVQHLTGLGIIEQVSNEVVIQDFIDPIKFSFESLIKHILQILSFMQETIIKALEERGSNLATEVSNLEDEVDRVYWLAVSSFYLRLETPL